MLAALAAEKRARRTAERAVDRVARLQAVTAALLRATTSEEISGVVLREGADALGASAAVVALRSEDRGTLDVVRAVGYPEEAVAAWRELPLDRPIPLTDAVRSAKLVLLETEAERDRRYPLLAEQDAASRAFAAVPLRARDRVLGVLGFGFARPQTFSVEDRGFLEVLGSQCAQAFERARLLEAERVARAGAERTEQRFRDLIEATIDGILVVSPEGEMISFNRRFVEMWEVPDDVLASRSDAAALEVVLEKIEDPQEFLSRVRYLYEHPHEESRDQIRLADGRIFDRWSAPLRGEDGTHYGRVWHFRDATDEDRMQGALRDVGERTAFLAEAAVILGASLDYEETLRRLARLSVPYLADWCIVDVLEEPDTFRRVAVVHADAQQGKLGVRLRIGESSPLRPDAQRGPAYVLRVGRADVAGEIPEDWMTETNVGDEDFLRMLKDMGSHSYACVPLVARGRTLGAITFVTAESGRRYSAADLGMAHELAARAALAVDNARLYRDRSHVARTLQATLLPPELPRIPGLEVAARYHAAGEGNEVGGDFYDLFHMRGRRWAIAMGDVCGKGTDAAALTALARYTLRAVAMQARRPQQILSMLNEAILRQRGDDRFCTVAFVTLERYSGAMRATIACGGHPAPMVRRRDGTVESVGRPGTLLGVFAEVDLTDVTVDLGPGDVLFMYTDGASEARRGGEIFGEERLAGVLAQAPGTSAAGIVDRIERAVLEFQRSAPRDDIALLALKVAD